MRRSHSAHFFEDFSFLAAFFDFPGFLDFVGSVSVTSTVCEMSRPVTPLAIAFRTAFLIRFTAFRCLSFLSFIAALDPVRSVF
jgi:hypothetical protein